MKPILPRLSAFWLLSIALMLGMAGGAGAQAIFKDTFAGTSGTALTAHTADTTNGTGASWSVSGQPYLLDGTGGVYAASSGDAFGLSNAVPASASYSVQGDLIFKTAPSGYMGVTLHSVAGTPGYALLYNGGNLVIYRMAGGFAALASVAYAVTAPQTIPKLTLVCTVSGSTASLAGYINGAAVSGLTATDTTATTVSTVGSGGLWTAEQASPTTLEHIANFAVGTNLVSASAPAGLTVGAGALTAIGQASAGVTFPAATGGTAPYTYQISRSPLSSSAAGTPVSGATGLTLSDTGLTPTTPYYYRITATDSTAPTAQTAVSGQVAAVTLPAAVNIGFSGTSITAGYQTTGTGDTPDQTCLALSGTLGDASGMTYHAVNAGVSGSTTFNWLPTDTATETTSGSLSTNNFGRSLTAFVAAGVHIVHVEDMGVNDSKTGSGLTLSQHQAYMSAIVQGYLANGYIVALDAPTYVVPGSYGTWAEASDAFLQSCQAQDLALASPGKVFFAGTSPYQLIANNPGILADGVHPNNAGGQLLGKVWARPLAAALTYNAPAATARTIRRIN